MVDDLGKHHLVSGVRIGADIGAQFFATFSGGTRSFMNGGSNVFDCEFVPLTGINSEVGGADGEWLPGGVASGSHSGARPGVP